MLLQRHSLDGGLVWQHTRAARKAMQDSIKRRGYAALYMFGELNREISPVERYK